MVGVLIGGDKLDRLIQLVEGDERVNHDHICLEIDRDHLRHGMPVRGDDKAIAAAYKVIKHDLAEKRRRKNAFVSIRLHIGDEILRVRESEQPLRLGSDKETLKTVFIEEESSTGFHLAPGEFAVFRTLEKISLPKDVAAFVQTRTTIAIFGIDATPTNQIVPGFRDGFLFLEVHNRTPRVVAIPRNAALAELFFVRTGGAFSGEVKQYEEVTKRLDDVFEREPPPDETSPGSWFTELVEPAIEFLFEPLLTAALFAGGFYSWEALKERIVSEHYLLLAAFGTFVVLLLTYGYLKRHAARAILHALRKIGRRK